MLKQTFAFLVATTLVTGNGWCVQGEATNFSHNPNLDVDFDSLSYDMNGFVSKNIAGELCNRECEEGDYRICYFKFTLEYYQAMGVACGKCSQGVEEDCNHPQCIVGDGLEKTVMSINRQIPGPQIHVCKGDVIVVDVHNGADGTATTIHWHGIHQRDTPYMDGVPYLTQCPIPFATSFRYQFKANNPGTQFYHAHAGHHKTNGIYGVLTIRQPKEAEPLSALYDHDLPEHHVFIVDWMHPVAEQAYPGLPSSTIGPDSVLINKRGIYTNPETLSRTKVKPTIYYVTRGKRYLFRLVNSVNHICPFQMQIERHDFGIIASDSFTVMERTFDTLISNAGERYDFILEASNTVGDYWMRVRGLGACAAKRIESYALIRYVNENYEDDEYYMGWLKNFPVPDFPQYTDLYPSLAVLNHPNATCWDGESDQCITELSAYEEDIDLRSSEPDYKIFLSFNNYVVSNKEIFDTGRFNHFENTNSNVTLVGAINKFSFTFPDYPPLTQPELINGSQFCNKNNRPAECNDSELCYCTHRIKVKKDSIVELIIVDETAAIGPISHPFHLHGFKFMVTGIGNNILGGPMTVERAKQLESKNLLPRDSLNVSPPFKDTVSIPSRGYAIVRLRADNPGFWLMHCHYEWHLSIGMAVVFQVGETSEMVKAPNDFPKCGNYLPSISNKLMPSDS